MALDNLAVCAKSSPTRLGGDLVIGMYTLKDIGLKATQRQPDQVKPY